MLENKSLGAADDVVRFMRGRVEVVHLPGAVVARAIFEPGWRWSEDVKSIAGTDTCQAQHLGYLISGRFHVRMDDGTERDFAPGDAHVVGPGHDAWVVGNEPAVIVDFAFAPEEAATSAGSQRAATSS
jgi:hypothetical protein